MKIQSHQSVPSKGSSCNGKGDDPQTCQTPEDKVEISKRRREDEEYRRLLDIERSKPGWETSQARQAWLHWG